MQQYRGTALSIKRPEGPTCPLCGSTTHQRTGKTGPFWSCSKYPECKGTLPVNGQQSGEKRRSERQPRQRPK